MLGLSWFGHLCFFAPHATTLHLRHLNYFSIPRTPEYIPEYLLCINSCLYSYLVPLKRYFDRFEQGVPCYKQYPKIVLDPFFPSLDNEGLIS
jgi:hypothetical protein